MNLINYSYQELFNKPCSHACNLEYSGKFKGFNGNIRLSGNNLTIKMSKEWEGVSDEIQIGLIQCLLLKIFKRKQNTTNIDLYNNFLRNVHIAIPKNQGPEILRDSFDRINNQFFHGLMERPNLKFNRAINRLGTYEYSSDTLTISQILLSDVDAMDYVMYHEMLHKKHKFKSVNNRTYHHTKDFREKEAEYPNYQKIEKRLQKLVNKGKFKQIFGLGPK
ncbi:MAG: M48 family metallopeptidase [Nanoarchaeota archaeon]|nr:M48 family metallopeptidase [Nanoarchaeota archaeon]